MSSHVPSPATTPAPGTCRLAASDVQSVMLLPIITSVESQQCVQPAIWRHHLTCTIFAYTAVPVTRLMVRLSWIARTLAGNAACVCCEPAVDLGVLGVSERGCSVIWCPMAKPSCCADAMAIQCQGGATASRDGSGLSPSPCSSLRMRLSQVLRFGRAALVVYGYRVDVASGVDAAWSSVHCTTAGCVASSMTARTR
jgi:hypothetical protein